MGLLPGTGYPYRPVFHPEFCRQKEEFDVRVVGEFIAPNVGFKIDVEIILQGETLSFFTSPGMLNVHFSSLLQSIYPSSDPIGKSLRVRCFSSLV
jgi:hypothetical protein